MYPWWIGNYMDPSSALYNAGAGMTTNLPNRSLRKFSLPICISDHNSYIKLYKWFCGN